MTSLSENGRTLLAGQLARIAYLRATGPNPFDYWLWADQTSAIIEQAYGSDSSESQRFRSAIREPGRTPDERGILGNMTLGLHGEWGIWARLTRAQQVLEEISGAAPQTA